jgi:hypothetical protein
LSQKEKTQAKRERKSFEIDAINKMGGLDRAPLIVKVAPYFFMHDRLNQIIMSDQYQSFLWMPPNVRSWVT